MLLRSIIAILHHIAPIGSGKQVVGIQGTVFGLAIKLAVHIIRCCCRNEYAAGICVDREIVGDFKTATKQRLEY